MKKLFFGGYCLLACLAAQAQTSPTKPVLAATLDSIHTEDQRYRVQMKEVMTKHGSTSPEMKELALKTNRVDSSNAVAVRAILDKYGWLGVEEVGARGSMTLFLVIQHAEQKVQEKYLPMMRKAAKAGKLKRSALAMLEDRIAIRRGKKQVYGSQLAPAQDGKLYVSPLKDPDAVDKRRAEVGLPPMSEYLKHFNMSWDVEAYKKELPTLVKRQKEMTQAQKK